jgi:hypothetical protein
VKEDSLCGGRKKPEDDFWFQAYGNIIPLTFVFILSNLLIKLPSNSAGNKYREQAQKMGNQIRFKQLYKMKRN